MDPWHRPYGGKFTRLNYLVGFPCEWPWNAKTDWIQWAAEGQQDASNYFPISQHPVTFYNLVLFFYNHFRMPTTKGQGPSCRSTFRHAKDIPKYSTRSHKRFSVVTRLFQPFVLATKFTFSAHLDTVDFLQRNPCKIAHFYVRSLGAWCAPFCAETTGVWYIVLIGKSFLHELLAIMDQLWNL